MELYIPFRKDSELFPDSLEKCEEKYRLYENHIIYVKTRVMEYLQIIEESRAQAEEIISEVIAADLDAQKEQDDEDCREEGYQDLDMFVTQDPELITTSPTNNISPSEGLYKRIEVQNSDI